MNREYKIKFQEIIDLLHEQNDPCCDSAEEEIEFAETIIKYLQHRIKGLKRSDIDVF